MPGSNGSFDIYKVAINNDGSFGKPLNLGDQINTKHREQFPFISDLNVLYFASNGHEGYGGLDIFRSHKVNEVFDKPVNLGAPLNSNLDDFAYIINEKNDIGYFSSNRSGQDNIYTVSRKKNRSNNYIVEGLVQDETSKELLPGALVTLFDDSNTVINDSIVGNTANYLFKIEPNKKYKIRGTRKLYIPSEVEFSTDSQGKVSQNILLNLKSYADAEEEIKVNEKGEVLVELEKIYFDYDKAIIKPDAELILTKLVNILKKYPEMEIEVSAHTDARGSDQYNLELSKQRAASTLNYLVNQGIAANRLKSIGYGEMQPLNNCHQYNKCTDEQYDINRRCEFKLLK